jgi:hypothetical protein
MPGMRARIPTEAQEQRALFQWVEIARKTHPELVMLFAIPNGGSRHPAEAKNLKLTGVRSGVPDMFLPIPRGEWHGLFIELKRVKGSTVEPMQKIWIDALGRLGYMAEICHGFESARKTICQYLGVECAN